MKNGSSAVQANDDEGKHFILYVTLHVDSVEDVSVLKMSRTFSRLFQLCSFVIQRHNLCRFGSLWRHDEFHDSFSFNSECYEIFSTSL